MPILPGIAASALMGLCWGSFLNMLAYRVLHGASLMTKRSYCPACRHTIAWYDLVPLASWLWLKGRCRSCKAPITPLYPLTELAAAACAVGLYLLYKPFLSLGWHIAGPLTAHLLFCSALLAASRTDLEAMLIPQLFSIWLVPAGLLTAWLGWLPLSFLESSIGACVGYGLPALVGAAYRLVTGRDGIGTGDMELLAFIGSCTGPLGVWASLMVGSLSGLTLGGLYLVATGNNRLTRIPFGPFLALGSLLYLFAGQWLLGLVLP